MKKEHIFCDNCGEETWFSRNGATKATLSINGSDWDFDICAKCYSMLPPKPSIRQIIFKLKPEIGAVKVLGLDAEQIQRLKDFFEIHTGMKPEENGGNIVELLIKETSVLREMVKNYSAKCARYEETLKFYAEPNNWLEVWVGEGDDEGDCSCQIEWEDVEIKRDSDGSIYYSTAGLKARAALATEKPE